MRQLRAEILRFLLAKKKATLEEIQSSLEEKWPRKYRSQLAESLPTLEKEGLIQKAGNAFTIRP